MSESQDNLSKPPVELIMVCGRNITVDTAYIPKAIYNSKNVYFCTGACLNAFLADPEGFQCAHSKTTLE